jgi:23S rRNA (pseudouridine1915-N3)-methyltransferase
MRLVVVSIGRLKQGPERELAERYRERFDDIGRKLGFRGLDIHEIPESRARDAATRMAEEAAAISAAIPEKSVLVALDERGDNIDSAGFARHLGRWRDEAAGNTIFAIGGADGLSPELRRKAKLKIAFGSATWPHQMVRVMLLEQIYRAATILSGHPYHRA